MARPLWFGVQISRLSLLMQDQLEEMACEIARLREALREERCRCERVCREIAERAEDFPTRAAAIKCAEAIGALESATASAS